jgi:hypothetical protein
MIIRSRLAPLVLIAAAIAAVASCDERSPTSPTSPPPPGVAIVGLKLVAPSELAPGESVQLIANAIKSDGSEENVSGRAEWAVRSSTASSVLGVTQTGLATGRDRGEEVVTVRLEGRIDQATIFVLPRGTFRLAGTVSENRVGLEKVRVTATSGVGDGLTTLTDVNGQYALYGVAGEVHVRATRDGYLDKIEQVTVTNHGSHSFEMVPSRMRTDYSGTYTLTVTAAGIGERCEFPDELKRRVYTANVEQQNADLKISLAGADFVVGSEGNGNSFPGSATTTGDITFWIRPSDPWDYGGPDVAERLSDRGRLYVAGTITARSTPTDISGTASSQTGASIIYHPSGSGPYGSIAGCPIVRFEMVRR